VTLDILDQPFALPADAVARFRRDGHVRLDAVLPPHEVERFRAPIAEVAERARHRAAPIDERDTYGKAFLQLFNLWERDSAEVRRFVLSRRFGGIAAALLGAERVRLYHDQALFKEPGGGSTPWHQDAAYWPLDGTRCITMWMALRGVDPTMGQMTFADGTHLQGSLADALISDESERELGRLVDERGLSLTEPRPMQAGDVTFHSGWTLHRAGANTTDTMRDVMTVIWFADGEMVREPAGPAQQHDLATWLPGCRPGDLAASPRNPVVEPA
jgi:ectoine hydroxylase-related dioxygenase (phytanoyl-CoA dioxygenase family)